MSTFPWTEKGAICKGDFDLGSHCGDCPKCRHYGWVKQKPVKPKKKVFLANEVIAGKIYSSHNPRRFMPHLVTIRVTEEPGYLRGHTDIFDAAKNGPGYSAKALVTDLETNTTQTVNVFRLPNDEAWKFVDVWGEPTLFEIPTEWYEQERKRVQDKLREYQQREEFLTGLAFKYQL